jgi:large subunit ribosomal protein L9e
MRLIKTVKTLPIPDGVSVTIKNRFVRVKGPRGVLTRDFGHQKIDLMVEQSGKTIRAELWNGDRKTVACVRTVITHIKNMITGVTKGFLFKMKMVYAHFPISINIENNGKRVEIRNFLGEKLVRVVEMTGDTVAKKSEDGTKDEITVTGSSLDDLSQSCANIQQICRVTDKDIRKFLDGVYVSYKGNVIQDE